MPFELERTKSTAPLSLFSGGGTSRPENTCCCQYASTALVGFPCTSREKASRTPELLGKSTGDAPCPSWNLLIFLRKIRDSSSRLMLPAEIDGFTTTL